MSSENLRNPFVVQCIACKTVISDSFSLQDMKHNYLIHSFCTLNLPEDNVASMSQDASFKNCIVSDLHCKCGQKVGKRLLSTSLEWNGYAGMYVLEKDSITSYVLGGSSTWEVTLPEISEDVEKLKSVVTKIYKKVYQ